MPIIKKNGWQVMDTNHRKELFSEAYVRAVASVAGFMCKKSETDMDCVDLTISRKGGNGTIRSPQIDVQLKCSENISSETETHISYPLAVRNYNNLAFTNFLVPRILVFVIVPNNIEEWINLSHDQMVIRKCGYWLSLRGSEESSNKESVTISIPKSNLLTAQAIIEIMDKVGNGVLL